MFELAKNYLPRWKRIIRLRMPSSMRIYPGSDREAIDATYDEGGRIIQLIVHTKSRSLNKSPYWS